MDICRDHLDLCHAGHEQRLDNTAGGASSLARTLARLARAGGLPPMVVAEATGPYHRLLVRALEAEGIAFLIINPKRVRDFARAIGQLAKNDRIDARILEQIGHALRLAPRSAAPEIVRRLQGLEGLRDDLVADLRAWKNRLKQHPGRQEATHIRAMIRTLGTRCARVEVQIRELIASDGLLATRSAILQEVRGVGERTACALLAWMPELGALHPRAAPALAGVAPFACDSGQWKGRRACYGGRARARSALYMAALVGSVHNEHLRATYTRLVEAKRPRKLALTALMRKLVTHLNTILKPHPHPCFEGQI